MKEILKDFVVGSLILIGGIFAVGGIFKGIAYMGENHPNVLVYGAIVLLLVPVCVAIGITIRERGDSK